MFSFVKSRPPLIIFFLCIVTLAVTIFCYAFYIKNTDLILDTDRKHDWLELLRHFNNLHTCLELNHNFDMKKVVDDSFIEMTTVKTLISIKYTDFIKKFATVQGVLTLDNWHTNCPKSYAKPSNLQIYFDIPEVATNATKFDVCVTIKGPEEYLPKFSEPNCYSPIEKQSEKLKAFLSTSVDTKHKEFCREGTLTKLEFHAQEKDNFANFLSDNEKSLIYIHLLWTSYFLVFILLVIIIYGTLHSNSVYDRYFSK
ncbi:hypothetical protein NQ314_000381 [Rhamnusium bicolor]|uniref:TMEM248/TMEM219 domain-containing protein n=1 Tax=Rhamnusium bicolor TaxID=1586634 RepID=A0AAV8ZXI7_9CUCU|nr:hypothetical protein NQ314_000381 [Rhamnusium bicolor]